MKKNIKTEKRKTLFICFIAVIIIVAIIYNIFNLLNQINVLKNEKEDLSIILFELNEKEKFLKVELEKLQNPDYIARYAREKYLFSKDGEFNIKID